MSIEEAIDPHESGSARIEEGDYKSGSADASKSDESGSSLSRKGQPWTEAEHLAFLAGLKKIGKGNWRSISRYFVPSRTPTQVASHAQKHFLRLEGIAKRRSKFSISGQEAPEANNSSVTMVPSSSHKEATATAPQVSHGFPLQYMVPPYMFGFPFSPSPFLQSHMCQPVAPVDVSKQGSVLPWLAGMQAMHALQTPAVVAMMQNYMQTRNPAATDICKPEAMLAALPEETTGLLNRLPAFNGTHVKLLPSPASAFKPLEADKS